MKKLTAREIVRMHHLAEDGHRPHEISRMLGISRNSVTAHLHGDVTYPREVLKRIRLHSPLSTDEWLCRRAASPWIPGHPSPSKMRTLMTTTSWMGHDRPAPLQSAIVRGRRVTRLDWLRQFVTAHYPPGIWIRTETLACYSTLAAANSEPPQLLSRRLLAFPLHTASRLAAEAGVPLDLPAALVHRAVKIEAHVGTAVI